MSNKLNAILIGLTGFTFFTGCIAFTTIADQNKNYAKSQPPAQETVINPNTLVATDYPPAGRPNSLPPATSAPAPLNAPVAASPPSQPQDTVAAAPTPPQPATQTTAAATPSPAAPTQPATPAPAATTKSKTTKTRAS